jgi:hypothetical protein
MIEIIILSGPRAEVKFSATPKSACVADFGVYTLNRLVDTRFSSDVKVIVTQKLTKRVLLIYIYIFIIFF